jgi:hypothetical protein
VRDIPLDRQDDGMDRRTYLASAVGSLAGTIGLAGCVGLREGPTTARLAWVWLVNDREEAYDVDVAIEDAEETVFAETYRLGTDPSSATPPVQTTERPVEGAGEYVVTATMDGETRTVDATEYVDGDEDCVGVRFSLLNDGSVDYWVKSMQQCSTPESQASGD